MTLLIITLCILSIICSALAWFQCRELERENKYLKMEVEVLTNIKAIYRDKWAKALLEVSKYKRPRDARGRFI